ncbi:LmeA family phospholipid-binding protein [Streptomyces chartreusis]|uniref:LmeA family phospholipid-binding protein n=1 Tax=Streptomyces chartreusis TaxID=1969 RepID=UPI0033CD3665
MHLTRSDSADQSTHDGGKAGSGYLQSGFWKRRRTLTVTAIGLLLVVPVATDRVATMQVEARTAEAFQNGMNTPERPDVQVQGFPVLPQMISGTLQHVNITAHDIPADGTTRRLPVTDLYLRLEDLRKSDDGREAKARSAEATAHLSYVDISEALGLEIEQGEQDSQIAASVPLLFNKKASVTMTVTAAQGNRIAFTDPQFNGGRLSSGAGESLLDRVFAKPIPLHNLPEGLALRSVTTSRDGIDAHFSGTSVRFRPQESGPETSSSM